MFIRAKNFSDNLLNLRERTFSMFVDARNIAFDLWTYYLERLLCLLELEIF